MTASRIYWRRAHPVRLPNRMDTQPHVELLHAYQRDHYEEISERLAEELERELQELRT